MLNTNYLDSTQLKITAKQQEKLDHQIGLIKGLLKVMNDVNKNEHQKYNMDKYSDCILGVNYKTNVFSVEGFLSKLFNVGVLSLHEWKFSIGLSKQEVKVINLFTTNVATRVEYGVSSKEYNITKQEWLDKAEEVVNELCKKYLCMFTKYLFKNVDESDVNYGKYVGVHRRLKEIVFTDKPVDKRLGYYRVVMFIDYLFLWDNTKEGYDYWYKLNSILNHHNIVTRL